MHCGPHLHADEKADLAVLVQHGRQREHVPELLARLCVVEDPDGDLLPILDRLADLLHRALVRVRALEKTAARWCTRSASTGARVNECLAERSHDA
eukprot:350959-Chlamydomonas_euryale.AAC.1